MKQPTTPQTSRLKTVRGLFVVGMAAVLAVNSAWAQSFPMPTDAPFDPNPAADNSKTKEVLTYGKDASGEKIPLKTVRITNNTDETVFPIMRDPNSATLPGKKDVGLYDPFDAPNKEYRGYIGFQDNGKYFFGLKPGESILVSIPLVFWNGARIGIGTDGKFLTWSGEGPNPYKYDRNAKRSITATETGNGAIQNGVVMWYRAEIAESPNDDTEDQLAEWTIRDHKYMIKEGITKLTDRKIPDNELVTLINYDVSNVDSLYLPVAMEVTDAWVLPQKTTGTGEHANRQGWEEGSVPDAYGWTGAINPVDELQKEIRAFTKTENNSYLGQYFEGKGWPFYNFPNVITDPNVPIKIPSGANVFPQSPLKGLGDRSSYDNEKYLLSSGGTGAIAVTIATEGSQAGLKNNQVRLSQNEPKSKIESIAEGAVATANPPEGKTNGIAAGTTVTAVDTDKLVVTLSKPLVASVDGSSISFSRPKHDYAAEAMIRLWYSWADHYLRHWKDNTPGAPTAPLEVTGSMEKHSATINFTKPQPNLVEGMAISGPSLKGIRNEVGEQKNPVVIMKMSSDKTSARLSQIAKTASTDQKFTVKPPQPLGWTPTKEGDPGYPLLKFTFGKEAPGQDPFEFSQSVYLAMAAINQIGEANNDNVFKFMQDIVGANMGFIFDQEGKDSDDGKLVMAEIRDIIKSVLRGVSDFTEYPDTIDAQGNHTSWYPDPATPKGGQKFNAFNLDPFVWFVHVKLGFSGYGFSIDDDTADVGAGGANHIEISVGGLKGLTNTEEWKIQAPFGPVKDVMATYSGPKDGTTVYEAIKSISSTTPMKVTTTGQHNLQNGDTVVIDQVKGSPAANGEFKVGHATKDTFELMNKTTSEPVGPKSPSDVADVKLARWSYPLRPYINTGKDLAKVFYRVDGDDAMRTFQGAIVTTPESSHKHGEEVRVWRKGIDTDGQLILNKPLTYKDGTPVPAGQYKFTFTGEE